MLHWSVDMCCTR